jgi:DNA-binding NarL/FixJ family response regulator
VTAAFCASVVLDDLADAIALARPPLVVVVVPGPTMPAVSAAAPSAVRRVTARRSDLADDGALLSRLGPVAGDLGGQVLLGELQWADDRSLDAIVDRARRLLDEPTADHCLVAVWRAGARRALLAELMAMASESGSIVEVVPYTEATLVAAGHEPDRAAALIAATGGLPDLLATVTAGGDIVDLVTRRLDVLDEPSRRAAELSAFGAPIDERDAAALAVEGLLGAHGDARLPGAVAAAVRGACPASRRAELVDLVAATGDRLALAHHLLELGDRSAAAAACYLDAARVAPGDVSVTLARAARESGADEIEARSLAASALVRTGRPTDALRELDGVGDVSAEHVRAAAWVLLGDPVAAATAFARAGEPGWASAMWVAASAECDVPVGAVLADAVPVDDGSVAALLAVAVRRWQASAFVRPDEVLADLVTAARRQSSIGASGDPLLAADLAVRVAERLGEHAVADRLASEALETADAVGRHHAHAVLLAGWVEARRGVLDGRVHRDVPGACLPPRTQLVRHAARCADAVRDPEGSGLDATAIGGIGAAAVVAPDLFDLDLRADIAAAVERARADHLGDPIASTEPLIGRCGPSHRFDLAWCRLQASLAGDRLDRVADRARDVLALDPAHDRHRLAAEIRALASVVAAPAAVGAAGEVVEVGRAFASAGMPHVAARLCGLVATATSDETVARLLLRESRAWRSSRVRVRRTSGGDAAVVRLSEQEERVGRMVLDGRTHKEIGAALFVSPKTVEHHAAHIRTKLGATSRAEMMAALRDYLDDLDSVD